MAYKNISLFKNFLVLTILCYPSLFVLSRDFRLWDNWWRCSHTEYRLSSMIRDLNWDCHSTLGRILSVYFQRVCRFLKRLDGILQLEEYSHSPRTPWFWPRGQVQSWVHWVDLLWTVTNLCLSSQRVQGHIWPWGSMWTITLGYNRGQRSNDSCVRRHVSELFILYPLPSVKGSLDDSSRFM